MAPHDSASLLSGIIAYTFAGQVNRWRSLGIVPECAQMMTKVFACAEGKPSPISDAKSDHGQGWEHSAKSGHCNRR
jgi:hypothetical protein